MVDERGYLKKPFRKQVRAAEGHAESLHFIMSNIPALHSGLVLSLPLSPYNVWFHEKKKQ